MANPKRTGPRPADNIPAKGDNFTIPEDRPFPTSRGMLSKEEIEALLRPEIPAELEDKVADNIAPLAVSDFSKPDPDETANLARNLASGLTLSMRSQCHIDGRFTISAHRKSRFSEMSNLAGAPVCLFVDASETVRAGLAIAGPLLKGLSHEACGGRAGSVGQPASLSVLEAAVVRRLLAPLAAAISPDEPLRLARIESDSDAIRSLLPAGEGVEVTLDCILSGQSGGAVLFVSEACLPEPVTPEQTGSLTKAPLGIGSLSVTLTARLASLTVPVSRLSNLKPGSTLLLGVPSNHPVDLLSGGRSGRIVAEAKLGSRGKKIAVQISQKKPITG